MSIEIVKDGNVLFLGTDLLRENARQAQEMVTNLRIEEADLESRLNNVRGTRRFMQKEYLRLIDRISAADHL